MARPRLGDSDTERLHIKITKAEVEAIESWRFEHKVASKSEAVRQLCEIGLSTDADLQGLARRINDAYLSSTRVLDNVVERSRPSGSKEFEEFVGRYLETIKDLIELSREIGDLASYASKVTSRGDPKLVSSASSEDAVKPKEKSRA